MSITSRRRAKHKKSPTELVEPPKSNRPTFSELVEAIAKKEIDRYAYVAK